MKDPKEIFFPFTFSYQLTQKGQRVHLLQGGDGGMFQYVKGDISLADAEALGLHFSNRSLSADRITLTTSARKYGRGSEFSEKQFDAPLTFEEALAEALATRQAKLAVIAAEKAEMDAAKQAALDGTARVYRPIGSSKGAIVRVGDREFRFTDDAELEALLTQREAAAKAAREAEEARKEAEEARRRAAKDAQIAAWVAEHGTQNQKERWAAGLLPAREIDKAMEDHAFAPAANLPLFPRIEAGDIEHESGCASEWDDDAWDLDCESADAASCTADEFESLKRIRELFPDAEVSIKRHTCSCSKCKADETRSGVFVKLTVGAFTFNREFAL